MLLHTNRTWLLQCPLAAAWRPLPGAQGIATGGPREGAELAKVDLAVSVGVHALRVFTNKQQDPL